MSDENENIKAISIDKVKSGDIVAKDVTSKGRIVLESGRILDEIIINRLKKLDVKVVHIRTGIAENFRLVALTHIKSGMTAVGPLTDGNGVSIFNEEVRKVLTAEDISIFKTRGVRSVRIIKNKASAGLFQTFERIEKAEQEKLDEKNNKIKEETRKTVQEQEFKNDVMLRKKIIKDSKIIEKELKETIMMETLYEVREQTIKKVYELFKEDEETLILLDSLYESNYKEVLEHGKELCDLAIKFGKYLNFDMKELVDIGYSAYLSDFSLIEINQKIPLLSQGGKKNLIVNEIHKHPLMSSEYAEKIGLNAKVVRAIREHHEREDGTGYPYGLEGDKISEYAKIIAIIDSYVSMIKKRHFKKNIKTPPQALRELVFLSRKNVYDISLIEKFVQMMTIYPVSTIVELNSGEIGVVTNTNKELKFLPKVTVIVKNDGTVIKQPKKMDLAQDNVKIIREVENDRINIEKKDILEILMSEESEN